MESSCGVIRTIGPEYRIRLAPLLMSPNFILLDRLTVLVVHILDLEDIFSFAKVVMIKFVPTGGSSDPWTREFGKRGEEETVTNENHRIDRERKYRHGYIMFE